jgi:hypothetical protein
MNLPPSDRRHPLRHERTVVPASKPRDRSPGPTSRAISGPLASRSRNCKNV